MSTIKTNNLQHTGSADVNLALDSSGYVAIQDGAVGTPALYFSGDSNTGIYSPGADSVAISTGGTARATVDSSGRLLVGTSSTSKLRTLVVQGNSGSANDGGNIQLSTGLATPANGDSLGYLMFADSSHDQSAQIIAQRDGGTWSGSSKPTRLTFSVTADGASSPSERMRITNNGYFKATSSGSYTYSASATHEFVNNSNGSQPVLRCSHTDASAPFGIYVNYTGGSPNNTSNPFFFGGDTTTTRFAVNSNGGIANYQSNNTNLSDRNAKKDISPATGTWDCLKQWEIVNYRYKDQPDDADPNLGVIAQQVAESCPEVITVFQEATEDQPEKLGVKEQQMYWMAIKALQEAQVRIEALEAEVAALKAQ